MATMPNTKNWRGLIKPLGLETETETLTSTYGKFVAIPLERGFGQTLGNSLRRIMLSSIRGAAITSIKIEGVLHEFSSLPGVKEDVTDIVLNLKEVNLVSFSEDPKTCYLKVTGPKKVLGSDIQTDSTVEVINGDHHILTLG